MTERSKGKMRPSLPRLREIPPDASGSRAEPSRDAQGRVTDAEAARELARGRGWKALIADMVGRNPELQGEARKLGRAASRLYRALLRELPHDGPAVRALVAAQARSAVVAARYAEMALEAGLGTDAGKAAIEMSAKLDARAERLGVTALDIATKLAKAEAERKPIDVHAKVFEAFSYRDPPEPTGAK